MIDDALPVHQPIESKLNTSAAFRYLVQTQHLDRLRVKKLPEEQKFYGYPT